MPSYEVFNKNKINVLRRLAEKAYEGSVDSNTPNDIAKELFPGHKPEYRCCVYKEREIIRQRTNLAMGHKPDGHEITPGQMVYVIEAACDDCDIHKVRITDNCRKCLFKPCQSTCHFGAIFQGNSKMHIDYSKCKTCGMCAKVCAYGAILISERPCKRSCPTGALKHFTDEIAFINEPECISCGRCAASCPFGAISEVSYLVPVIDAIKQEGKKVVAMVAPAVMGQFGKCTLNQVYSAIKALGFDEVVEVAKGADLTTVSEAEEALKAKAEGRKLTTSCCPAFVELIKMKFPKVYAENTSDTLSPMAITARMVKKENPDCVTVFVGPCVAKKKEITLEKNKGFVDYVITFEELNAMFQAKEIVVSEQPDENIGVANGSKSGRNFCQSGGVAKSLNDYLAEKGVETRLTLKAADGSEMCIEYLKQLNAGKQEEDVLEGMMCQGGCISGVCSLVTNPLLIKRDAEKENAKTLGTNISDVIKTTEGVETTYEKTDIK